MTPRRGNQSLTQDFRAWTLRKYKSKAHPRFLVLQVRYQRRQLKREGSQRKIEAVLRRKSIRFSLSRGETLCKTHPRHQSLILVESDIRDSSFSLRNLKERTASCFCYRIILTFSPNNKIRPCPCLAQLLRMNRDSRLRS